MKPKCHPVLDEYRVRYPVRNSSITIGGAIILTIVMTIVINGGLLLLPFWIILFFFVIPKILKHFDFTNRFVNEKGWVYYGNFSPNHEMLKPIFSGYIFQQGEEGGSVRDLVGIPKGNLSDGQEAFIFGNYYTSSEATKTLRYGFIRIELPKYLPHILIDSRKNNSFIRRTNLPDRPERDQLMKISIGFDDYFDTYVPRGYERDALEILTTDLMGDLVEYGSMFDFEIVDNALFIYSSPEFDILNPKQHEIIFNLVRQFAKELIHKAGRYKDYRDVSNKDKIALAGRRLK